MQCGAQKRYARKNVVKMGYGYGINFLHRINLVFVYWIGLKGIRLEISLPDFLWEACGRGIRMSCVNKLFRAIVILRVVTCILVTVLINRMSPLVLRAYECRLRGQPIIPLTEFALRQLPHVLLLFSLGMLVQTLFLRSCGFMRQRFLGEVLTLLFVMGCILYCVGSVLPFIIYNISVGK